MVWSRQLFRLRSARAVDESHRLATRRRNRKTWKRCHCFVLRCFFEHAQSGREHFRTRKKNVLTFLSATRMTLRSAAAVASNQLAALHQPKEPCALAVAVPQKMARLLFGKSNHDCSTACQGSNGSKRRRRTIGFPHPPFWTSYAPFFRRE